MKNTFLILVLIIPLWACEQNTRTILTEPGRTTTDESVIANINLGVEYMQRREYQNALTRLERARDTDPGYYGSYGILGVLHQRIGDNEAAEDYFKKALQLNPADSSTYNNFGQFLCAIGRYEDAQKYFLESASNPLYMTPEMPTTNAGLCAQRSGDVVEAEKYFRQALGFNPTQAEALYQMSEISFYQDNYLSARGYLQRFLAVANHSARSLWLGIRTEKELGDSDTEASYALLLRNNFPDSTEAMELRESGIR